MRCRKENNQREPMAIRTFSSATLLAENITGKCIREHFYLQINSTDYGHLVLVTNITELQARILLT